MRRESRAALVEWAVTCDALARGEQILLLRADELGPSVPRAGHALRHSEFWLHPIWHDQLLADLTDPYRDRLRRLLQLHRDDGKLRLRHYATVEYRERIVERARLLRLDGEHTLNGRAVEDRLAAAGQAGMWLLLLRVYEPPDTTVLDAAATRLEQGPWVDLGRPIATEGARPVVANDRFRRERARLLQRAESIQAV